uniref:Large ribosomal subunit protein mL42 n=1 Tax=Salvator merianae TaxID=96440 RepID=A0A8D0BGT4_SALMN
MWMHLSAFSRKALVTDSAVCCSSPKSTYSPLPDNYNCKVGLALTSDGKTIVCYHPSVDILYEHTILDARKPTPLQIGENDVLQRVQLQTYAAYSH